MKLLLWGVFVALLLAGCANPSSQNALSEPQRLSLKDTERAIVLYSGRQPVLSYQKAVMPPPRDADARFARSGFIHPLYSPHGGLLTQIHPQGHFHHMGLWHAWVKTTFKNESLDFWNLDKGEGGIRYEETVSTDNTADSAGFTVRQAHYALRDGIEETVLSDTFSVRLQQQEDVYLIDYETQQTNVSDAPIVMEAYRYGGGIAYRGPSYWGEGNSDYLTSRGLGRQDGHGSEARWVRFSGPTETGEASVTILSHPSNVHSPQPVRIWPEGPMFFNYVPAQNTPLTVAPGETLTLRYRVLVTDGYLPPETIETFWQGYSKTE